MPDEVLNTTSPGARLVGARLVGEGRSGITPSYSKHLEYAPADLVLRVVRDCRGALLLETAIAAMVFAMVGVAVLVGLRTAFTAGTKVEVQSVAENLARNQMEAVFSGPYREPNQTPYPTMTGIPPNYSVTTSVESQDAVSPDPEVEIISVTARHDGQDILTLETMRARNDGLQLRYSILPTRWGSGRLHGETISGIVYVFLDDPELMVDDQVDFYLDGAYIHTDRELSPLGLQGNGGHPHYRPGPSLDYQSGPGGRQRTTHHHC